MNPRSALLLTTSITTCLLATAARAVILPYAEFRLGEAGSLGASNKPQDNTGNNRHYSEEINGGNATTGNASFHANATGSTAYLDTSGGGNEGWYSGNVFSTLPTDNFAMGVFARAAGTGTQNGDIFTTGGGTGAFKIGLENSGWAASCHNIAWIGNVGTFQANTWVHLALVRSGGVTTFYVDGVAQGSSFNGAPTHSSPHMSVSPGGGAYFDGNIDEARIVTFSPGESTANVIAALQGGIVPNALVGIGNNAHFRAANLSTDTNSIFRLGGAVVDSAVIAESDGLSVVTGTAPKHIISIAQEGPIDIGSYPLIDYSGTIGGLGFTGLQLAQLPGRIAGNLVNNTVDSVIELQITGSQAGDITWTGSGGGVWDEEGNAGWVFTGTSTATKFYAGDTVNFNDSATTKTVNITEPVTPAAIFVTGNQDYTFSGSGIGGSATLDKIGPGTLTFTNNNSHSGAIFIEGGTLRVGDGGSTGSLGSGFVTLDGANLVVNRTGEVTVSNGISGDGGITKLGDGRLLLTGNSSFTGPVTVTEGILASGNANCLGSNESGTTVAATATLDAFSGGFGSETITIQGNGVNDEGAIINTGEANQLDGVMHLVLAADSAIGGPRRWDIRGDDATVTGNFTLTKIGGNQISVVNADISVPNLVINAGMVALERGANVDNTNPGLLTVNSGGALGFGDFGAAVACTKPILMNGGRMTTTWWDADGSAIIAAPVQLEAATSIQTWSGATLTYNGAFTGTGSLVKDDAGTVVLNGAHSYGGSTTVNGGTLTLANTGLADDSDVSIASGAVLNLTFTGTDTVETLTIGGVQQAAGVYDSTHASGRFTGSGSLTVSTGPVGTPYQLWETANGIAGAGSTADSDGDGISNGIEFVIGGDPSGPGSDSNAMLPTITKNSTHLVFVFRRTDASVSAAPKVEFGTTLLPAWTTAVNGTGGVTILEEDNAFGAGVDRVTVSIPLPVGDTKLFARLRVDL